jgi:hypothetical protein
LSEVLTTSNVGVAEKPALEFPYTAGVLSRNDKGGGAKLKIYAAPAKESVRVAKARTSEEASVMPTFGEKLNGSNR